MVPIDDCVVNLLMDLLAVGDFRDFERWGTAYRSIHVWSVKSEGRAVDLSPSHQRRGLYS